MAGDLMDIFLRTMHECGFGRAARDELNRAYHEPWRYYHDLGHIGDLLHKIESIPGALMTADPTHLKQVAWWHDHTYDVKPGVDEQHSADYMQIHMGLDDDDYRIQAVLDTAGHTDPSSDLSALFMDLDLSRIGNPNYDDFILDGEKIRAEYRKYSDWEWLNGRRAFLQNLTQRDSIFHTRYGRNAWERNARHNIRRAVAFYDRRIKETRES